MKTLRYLLEKEFKQLIRNKFLARIALMYPIMVMLVMPWATTMDLKNSKVSIVDQDHSSLSRRLIHQVDASSYFSLYEVVNEYALALDAVEKGNSDIIVEIPEDFSSKIAKGENVLLPLSANAVDGTKGSLSANYMVEILQQFNQNLQQEKGASLSLGSQIAIKRLYNETENYRYFMLPGLIVFILIILTGFLPALNIVNEKEIGTIEQINVTPIRKYQFILAKLIPYWTIGLIAISLCFLIMAFFYGLTPASGFVSVYLLSLLFISVMSGFGLMISNYSSSMQQATFVMFFFILIFILMSGLFTPVSSMPPWGQAIAAFIPPHYYIDAMRALYLKGSALGDLQNNFLMLLFFSVIINLWAVKSYNKVA